MWSRRRINGVGRLTFDLLRAHEGQRCGEVRHGWSDCGGVSVLIVVGLWYCRRLPDVGSGWWVREVKWSSAGYLWSILTAVSRFVSRALTYHVATGNM